MIPNNDPLYQTKNSKIQRFAPFMDNIKKEKQTFKNHLKPIFKWCGGKRDELPYIYKFMPPINLIDTYIEPFVGGGAVYFSLNHNKNIINDCHPEVVNFYRVAKTNMDELYKKVITWNNDEKEYYFIRNDLVYKDLPEKEKNVLLASRFYYLRKTCFRGMLRYNSKGEFNIPFGRYKNYNVDDYFSISSKDGITTKVKVSLNPDENGYNRFSVLLNEKGKAQESLNNALSKNPGSKRLKNGTITIKNKEYEWHLVGLHV
jgi:hypothetical protein